MKGAIGSGLFESLGGGVYSLSGGGEGASGQRFDVLRMSYFSSGVDDFLASFKKFLGKPSELKDFSFNERVA